MTVDLVDLRRKIYEITGTDLSDRTKKVADMLVAARNGVDHKIAKEVDLLFNEYVLNESRPEGVRKPSDPKIAPAADDPDLLEVVGMSYDERSGIIREVNEIARLLNCQPEETPMKIAKLLQELDSVKLELETLQKETHA